MTEFRLLIDGTLVEGTSTLNVINPATGYAGAKPSGIETELGREGLEEFTQATIINVAK